MLYIFDLQLLQAKLQILAPNYQQTKVQIHLQYKMTTSLNQQKVNLVCYILAIFGLFTLLAYWEEFSTVKKTVLTLLTALFLFVILRNHKKKLNANKKPYSRVRHMRLDQQKTQDDTLVRLSSFFSQLGDRAYSSEGPKRNQLKWSNGGFYSSQGMMRKGTVQSNYYGSFNQNQQNDQKIQKNNSRNNIRFQIPQNITSISEQIKERLFPNKFLNEFCDQLRQIQGRQQIERGSSSSPRRMNMLPPSSSLVFDKDRNLLLTQSYDVLIANHSICVQEICDHIENKLQNTFNLASSSFKQVSEIVMKCFGLKVVFSIKEKQNYGSNSNDISIFQLKNLLITLRRNSFISERFRPIIPIKDFMNQYLQKLALFTNNALRFVEMMQDRQLLAFKVYINIMKQEFPEEKIQISTNISSLSEQMKRIKHAFYVHNVDSDIYITYSRIKGFRTSNPIVAVLAFFAQIYKIGTYKQVGIVRETTKFFKQK